MSERERLIEEVSKAFNSLVKMYVNMSLEERQANAKDSYPGVRELFKSIGADYTHINTAIDCTMIYFLGLYNDVTDNQYEIYYYATQGHDRRTKRELEIMLQAERQVNFNRMYLDIIKDVPMGERNCLVRFGLSLLSSEGRLTPAAQNLVLDIYLDCF